MSDAYGTDFEAPEVWYVRSADERIASQQWVQQYYANRDDYKSYWWHTEQSLKQVLWNTGRMRWYDKDHFDDRWKQVMTPDVLEKQLEMHNRFAGEPRLPSCAWIERYTCEYVWESDSRLWWWR